jgi:hypothetical protein
VAPRARSVASTVLAAIGAVALFVGALYAWAAPTLFDDRKFAARARAALDESPALREVVARTLVTDVIERNRPDLIAFRPVLIAAADTVVRTDTFGDVFESSVRQAHRFFTEEPTDNLVARANDAALLLIDTLRTVAPDVADRIPDGIEPALFRIRDASAELGLWRAAERTETLAWVLPLVGVLAWLGAFVLARDRRAVLVRLGVVLTAGGVVVLGVVRLVGRVVVGRFDLPLRQQAAHDVWAVFTDGLVAVAWSAILAGIVLAAAVQAITRDESRLNPARIRALLTERLATEPRTRLGRVAVGIAAVAVGVAMFTSPIAVLEVVVMVLGAFVVYAAIVYVLDVLVLPAAPGERAPANGRAWAVGVAGSLGVLLVGGVVTYLLVTEPASAERVAGCNGRIELCLRRLDEVALPTTHNAPTAAEDDFLLPNQERGIAAQLRDGVRGFQIDAYLGTVRTGGGIQVVFTDLDDNKLLSIENTVGPELTAQALEFRRIVGPPAGDGRQDVWLCHNFCELGAVRASDTFATFRRFLERNPAEVLVWVVQDELPAERLLPVLEASGLERYVATIDWSERLPTLGALVASGQRLVIGLEHGDLGPAIPNVFRDGVVQEVPYNYRSVAELVAPDSCRPLRGRPDAPLFQFNHWVTPASAQASRTANTASVLGERVARCQAERGLLPNLVAVDFYERGDLFGVVDALNDEIVEPE